MAIEPQSDSSEGAQYADLPCQEGSHMLTHAEMRGMFYRNEITREVLWQLERHWANGLGKPLPESALARLRLIAETEGERHWFWHEEQTLPAAELLALAKRRKAEYQACLPQPLSRTS